MNDIAAALGLVQLAKLDRTNGRRRQLAERYGCSMRDVEWLELPVEKEYTRSAWHNYVIKVVDPGDRNPLIGHLKERGISTGVHYIPNHLYAMYRPYAEDPLPVAEEVWKRIITLPLFPDLTEDEQDSVVEAIRSFRRN
jgi:perosamine synthetase